MTFDLTTFTLADMCRLGAQLRTLEPAPDLFGMCSRGTRLLYDSLVGPDGQRAVTLARLFVTMDFARLPPDVQSRVSARSTETLAGNTPCLALVGTAGERPEWNDPVRAVSAPAVPLASDQAPQQFPVVSGLLRGMGVQVGTEPLDEAQSPDSGLCGVFYVADAADTPYIRVPEFLEPHGVRSILAFGGALENGALYAAILFLKLAVSTESALLFRTVSLNLALCLFPYLGVPASVG